MIYTEYRITYYGFIQTGRSPVYDYIDNLASSDKAKIFKYIGYLRLNKGYIDEPYSRHIVGKIRELRVDFGKQRHRVFYFTCINKNIIILHAFLKRTPKMPAAELNIAIQRYKNVINSQKLYE